MKKILVVLLGLVLLCGCQSKKEDKITFAAIFPLTGTASETGDHIQKAADLCIKKWNQTGGVIGKQVDIKYYDHQGLSKNGATIANQIVSTTKIDKVLGTFSGTTLSAQPIFERNKVLQYNFVSTNDVLKNSRYTLRCFPSTYDICRAFMKDISVEINPKRIVILYANTEYGKSFYNEFISMNDSVACDFSIQYYVYDEAVRDYRDHISKMKLTEDDILFIAGQYHALGIILKQIRESGYTGKIFGDTHLSSPAVVNIIQNQRDNIYYIAPKINAEISSKIQAEYYNEYGIEMDDFSMIMYMGLDLLLTYMNEIQTMDNEILMSNIEEFEYSGIMHSIVLSNVVQVEFDVKPL